MRLLIDNFDSAGPRDYTGSINADSLPRITRHLNRPAEAALSLVAIGPAFVVPVSGARITLSRADGLALFTGYIASTPDYEYLGWGQSGPVYRYAIHAVGDEFLLDRRRLTSRLNYVNRSAGDILADLTRALAPDSINTSAVENTDKLTYSADPDQPFSHHAAELALRTRSVYRAHDGALSFHSLGSAAITISESDADFSPDALSLTAPDHLANDVAVFGNVEPQAHVKDYFLGDGVSLGFYLSHEPFSSRTFTLLDEEYASPLNTSVWTQSGAVSVTAGALNMAGATTLSLNDEIELGGALTLQHGDFDLTAPCDGIAGGLFSGSLDLAHLVAGFLLSPSGGQTRIQPIVNCGSVGTPITTQPGRRYFLTTRFFSSESYRHQRAFHSSTTTHGDSDLPAAVRAIFEVRIIDPANPGTIVAPATILYDGLIPSCPPFATYAVATGSAMNASISFTRHLRAQDCFVSSTIPGRPTNARLVGPQYEGAVCHVSTTSLRFYADYVPAPNEAIRVVYRAPGKSSARLTDPASISQHTSVSNNDDGVRVLSTGIASPSPRTSAECELAASALLDDRTQQAWSGSYSCWSHLLPQFASDIWPGDAVSINVPSRAANFTSIAHKVVVELTDLTSDISRYTTFFANDAAAMNFAYALDQQSTGNASLLTPVSKDYAEGDAPYLPDLPDAELTSADSITLNIDCGVAPPADGGIEVRRSDTGWSSGRDRNLMGRFTTRTFSVPRLTRSFTIYLRQYDATGRYSRYSTALHIDYPQ